MKVYVPTETRFRLAENGKDAVPAQPIHVAAFWARYLDVFDRVVFTGRLAKEAPKPGMPLATNDRIEFMPIELGSGAGAAIRSIRTAWRTLMRDGDSAVCLRMPTLASALVGMALLASGKPFGVEVVGDPAESLRRSVARKVPFRAILRAFLVFAQKQLCRKACAAAYVTQRQLQRRYPPGGGAMQTYFSSIEMTEDFFRPRADPRKRVARLLHVGSMGKGFYKGQDVLLRAFSRFAGRNPGLHLALAGGGESLPMVKEMIKELGLGARASAVGHVASVDELRNMLDEADLFVFPSLTEGLPKALVEAMARGLPAVASRVGGIGELLPDYALVPAGDPEALADKIQAFLDSPELRERASNENYAKAREYHIEHIRPRRADYYRRVRDATQQWMERNGACPQ